jgi:Leucine-rich repeat (LRR) protein
LYDNLIHRIQNLDDLENLTSLDLSYNKIKHIKNIGHLKKVREIFFVQNGISRIEELDGLVDLVSLELGANRIRVIRPLFWTDGRKSRDWIR